MWPWPAVAFSRQMQRVLTALGLGGAGFAAASLRAGGATTMLERGDSLTTIRFAASWASERSVCAYLQEAESERMSLCGSRWLLQEFGARRYPPLVPRSFVFDAWTPTMCSASLPPPRSRACS